MRGVVNVPLEQFLKLSQEKQQQILDAAIQEFASEGYALASTNHIVERAGISKGVLFKYFSNKEQLFLYLCEYVADRRGQWLSVPKDELPTDLFDILRVFAVRDLEFLSQEPQHYAFVEQVMRQHSDLVGQQAIALFNAKGQAMFEAMIQALPSEDLREGVIMADAMNMIHWVFTGFNQYMRTKIAGDLEQRTEEIIAEIDHAFDLLKYGIYKR
jgi:TetR/AcrR family transcriptional regulator